MARLLIEGFESGHKSTLNIDGTNMHAVTSSPPAGLSGSYYWDQATGGYGYSDWVLPSDKTELFFAIKVKAVVRSGNGPGIITFYDSAGTAMAGIFYYLDGTVFKIRATRGAQNSGNVLGTGSIEVAQSSVTLVECRYVPSDSAGIMQVKVDGVLDIDIDTGDATDTTAGLESIHYVRFGSGMDNLGSAYDDLVIDDADWIGLTRIQKLAPTGAGTSTQWTASAGNNYECVNEIPYSDTDYISTNVAEEIDSYACGDLTGSIASIKSLALTTRVLYEGEPTPSGVAFVVRTGGSYYSGEALYPPLSWGKKIKLFEENPGTAAAWTSGEIDGIEIGLKALT